MSKADDVRLASRVNFSRCADPMCCCDGLQFFINLYDAKGEMFAQAALPADTAKAFAEALLSASAVKH